MSVSLVKSRYEQGSVLVTSLTEAIDTTTPAGRLLFHVAAAFAEFERVLIQERTRAGLAAARDAGRVGGRPTVMSPDKLTAARALIAARKTHAEAASAVGVSLSSLRRALRATLATQATDSAPGTAGASTDVEESSRSR